MRILHIDPDDIGNPVSGGGPVRTFEICRRLARRHEVTVLTPSFPGSTPQLERDGVRYVRLGRRIGNHGSSHHVTFFFAVPAQVRRRAYDLVVEDFMPPMSATFTPLFAKTPLIASVQWFFARLLSEQYKLPFWIGEEWGVCLYRHFVVLTPSMKRRIESLNRHAECSIIPNGVDEALFDLPLDFGQRSILYLGRIDTVQKGVDLLLQAYAALPAESRLPLVLAGQVVDESALRRLIASLGLTRHVTLFGRFDAMQRAQLLAQCRLLCVPSRDETFGMTIAEGCAAGKVVVYFDQPPMNEVAAPACEKVPAFNVSAYAAAIGRLIHETDDNLLRRSAQCRDWAHRFRWDEVARLQEDFYNHVVLER